jgi:hypothetical protein
MRPDEIYLKTLSAASNSRMVIGRTCRMRPLPGVCLEWLKKTKKIVDIFRGPNLTPSKLKKVLDAGSY